MGGTMLVISTLLFIAGSVLADEVRSKVVTIDQGPVKGYKSSKGNFFVFYGVPYATAPTGSDKFKSPLPAPTWTEPFEAVDKNVACPQATTPMLPITESKQEQKQDNCLIANVYVPDTKETNLPVVVNVHGGAYQVGVGNLLTPHALVNEGQFIYVNFNYRLGIIGFLCLGTEDVPGNAGMKDQVALLRWVKKNIASFGGNPHDVTIGGYSAGSSAVELLMVSEMAKGLFHKVIPESGAGVSSWSVQIDPIENAKTYARRFNITSNDVRDLETFYKKASIADLTTDAFLGLKDSTLMFVPCIERETKSERFLKSAPVDILKNDNFPKVPVLIGFSNMEGLFRAPLYPAWKDEMNTNFAAFLPADMEFGNDEQKNEIAQSIKTFYFGAKPVDNETIQSFVNYFTDVMFAYPALRSAKLLKEAGNHNVFLYEYSYVDDLLPASPPPFNSLRGANHCGETSALLEYPSLGLDGSADTADSKRMKSLMRKLWISFIKSGKPLPEATSAFPKGWPAVSSDGSPYMELNSVSELSETGLLAERFAFWDKLYERHYRKPVPPTGA